MSFLRSTPDILHLVEGLEPPSPRVPILNAVKPNSYFPTRSCDRTTGRCLMTLATASRSSSMLAKTISSALDAGAFGLIAKMREGSAPAAGQRLERAVRGCSLNFNNRRWRSNKKTASVRADGEVKHLGRKPEVWAISWSINRWPYPQSPEGS